MTTLLLSACCGCNTKTSETTDGNMSRLIIKLNNDYNRHFRVIEFGYNGHDYIMFLGAETMSVIHNPNCNCMNKFINY